MSWTYEECTATLIVGSGYGPVGLDCVLRQGHRGPHRDSDGDVLWFPTKRGERSIQNQRAPEIQRQIDTSVESWTEYNEQAAVAHEAVRKRRQGEALAAFTAGLVPLIQGRRVHHDSVTGRPLERRTTMHLLQNDARTYCGLLDPSSPHVIRLEEVDPNSRICGTCSYKYGYDIEAGAHESGDPS